MADLTVTLAAAYGVQAYALAGTSPQGQGKSAPFDQTSSVAAPEQSGDQVSLSKKGKELSAGQDAYGTSGKDVNTPADTRQPETKKGDQQGLNEADLRQIEQLKSRDIEVRTHEQAHLAVAGQYAAGGPSFSYQTGADGKRYAVGGSVPIDMGKESTPAATIMKMRTVKRAALAPANPSAADRQIAAQAGMQEMQAMQQEVQTTQLTENQDAASGPSDGKKSESPENSTKNNTQKAPASFSDTNQPSAVTRTMMSAAYKAMASLA